MAPFDKVAYSCSGCGRRFASAPEAIADLIDRGTGCPECGAVLDLPEPFASYERGRDEQRGRAGRQRQRQHRPAAGSGAEPTWREELVVVLLEAEALALLLAWVFRHRLGYSPMSAVASGFGGLGLLFLLGRMHDGLRRLGWSLTKGKGRALVWAVFGCSAALVPLGGFISLLNRWAWSTARPLLRWPVVVGASVLFAAVFAARSAAWEPLDPLRRQVASMPVDAAYELEVDTWAGRARPRGGTATGRALGGLLAAFGFDDVPMILHVQSVEEDSWLGRVDIPGLQVSMPVEGVHRHNQLAFYGAFELAGTSSGEPVLMLATITDGQMTGGSADGALTFDLEPGAAGDTGGASPVRFRLGRRYRDTGG